MKFFSLCFILALLSGCKPQEPVEISYKLDSTNQQRSSKLAVRAKEHLKINISSNSLCPAYEAHLELQLKGKLIGEYTFSSAPAGIDLDYIMPESGELTVITAIEHRDSTDACVWLGEVFYKISY